jgi:replication factor C large subunit
MPYLAVMTHHCKNRELTVAMTAHYDFDADHVSFVTGSGKDTNKIQRIVEDAQQRREESAVEHSGGAFEGRAESDDGSDDSAETAHEEDGQATLAESSDESDGEPENEEQADDQQAGLGDFV